MTFPFALSRMILLFVIIVTNAISSVLSAIAFHETTGSRVFQVFAIAISVLTPLTIIGCLCHQLVNRDEETSNTRNVCLFGICGLLGFILATLLTVHALQDHDSSLCNDFANVAKSCIPAGVQLGMAYVSFASALVGCVISWIDKFPGAVKVTARYPVTAEVPSSHFADRAHDLDGNYTRPPTKTSSRSRNNTKWNDATLHC